MGEQVAARFLKITDSYGTVSIKLRWRKSLISDQRIQKAECSDDW